MNTSEVKENKFFKYSDIVKILEPLRGQPVQIAVVKKDESIRTLKGILGKNEAKCKFIINEGDDEETDFKMVNCFKVIAVKTDSLTYRPKGE